MSGLSVEAMRLVLKCESFTDPTRDVRELGPMAERIVLLEAMVSEAFAAIGVLQKVVTQHILDSQAVKP